MALVQKTPTPSTRARASPMCDVPWRSQPPPTTAGNSCMAGCRRSRPEAISQRGQMPQRTGTREHSTEMIAGRRGTRQSHAQGACRGKLLNPERRCAAMRTPRGVTSRHCSAGSFPGFPTQGLPPGWSKPQHPARPRPTGDNRGGEAPQTDPAGPAPSEVGRRLVYHPLRIEGWSVNHKRVQRIWREEGLQRPLPRRQKRSRPADGSGELLRAEYPHHCLLYTSDAADE